MTGGRGSRTNRSMGLAVLAVALVACSSATSATVSTASIDESTTLDTVAIGDMPVDPATSTSHPSSTAARTVPRAEQLGARATGNRVILIGDSVMASTATRHGDAMCEALVPLGWQVDVEAETGQFAPWGNKVLDAKQGEHFDVAVVLLGNNYLGDELAYRTVMERIVDRLSPALVVLSTVTEFQPDRREVNAVIRAIAADHPDITVLDWAARTAEDRTLTGGDHLHLGTKGRAALAAEVALLLGQAQSTSGKCLPSTFDDDSRGSVTGTTTTVASTGVATSAPSSSEPSSTEPTTPSTGG